MSLREIPDHRRELVDLIAPERRVLNGFPFARIIDEVNGEILSPSAILNLRVVEGFSLWPQSLQIVFEAVRAVRGCRSLLLKNEEMMGITDMGTGMVGIGMRRYMDFLTTSGSAGLTPRSIEDREKRELLEQAWKSVGGALEDSLQALVIRANHGKFPGFSEGLGAHVVGVLGLLHTIDDWYILVERNPEVVAVHTDGLHLAPTGGALWRVPTRKNERFRMILEETLEREALEEFGIARGDYEPRFLGGVRELARGGNPEFFFLMKLLCTRDQFLEVYQDFDGPDKNEARHLVPIRIEDAEQDSRLHPKTQIALQLLREAM